MMGEGGVRARAASAAAAANAELHEQNVHHSDGTQRNAAKNMFYSCF